MSRSGYTNDCDEEWVLWFYRSAVKNAINGKRGQQFLRDLVAALDALPAKRLIEGKLEWHGEVCAFGSVGKLRGLSMSNIDVEDGDLLAALFGVAPSMAREIMYENDEIMYENDEGALQMESPEDRWIRMRQWAVAHLRGPA